MASCSYIAALPRRFILLKIMEQNQKPFFFFLEKFPQLKIVSFSHHHARTLSFVSSLVAHAGFAFETRNALYRTIEDFKTSKEAIRCAAIQD